MAKVKRSVNDVTYTLYCVTLKKTARYTFAPVIINRRNFKTNADFVLLTEKQQIKN
jgi:hypothetical protein